MTDESERLQRIREAYQAVQQTPMCRDCKWWRVQPNMISTFPMYGKCHYYAPSSPNGFPITMLGDFCREFQPVHGADL